MAEKAQKRDDHACRFCGFRSLHYQRTIPFAEAGDPPLATVCTFCEQVLSLDRAGMTGAGLLLWLPEISQVELNHLARAIYVARADKNADGGAMAALATRALDALTARRAEAKKRLGSDDPLLLATIMRESLEGAEIEGAVAKLDGIRLLPAEKYMMRGAKGDVDQFPQIVKYWLSPSGPFGGMPPGKWREILQKTLATAGNA
jgi:hypothetical protein